MTAMQTMQAMHSPFKILNHVRRYKPDRAYYIPRVTSKDFPDFNYPLVFPHNRYFIETCFTVHRVGFLYTVRSDLDIKVHCFNRHGKRTRWFDLVDIATTPQGQWTYEMSLAMFTMVCLNEHLRSLLPETHEHYRAVHDERERMEVYERKGDTMKYVRLSVARERAEAQAHMDEIIRRREHEVRGHWRRLRSGQLTWVRAHKRGDPELGHVETHYVVE